jgi:hypothetical protein
MNMNRSGDKPFELSGEDQRVLDALAESGFDPQTLERMPASDRPRGKRLIRLLGLLRDYPVEDGGETLIHATLAGIDRYESARARRMSIDPAESRDLQARRFRRLPLPSLISVAATILIGASIILPILHNLRQQQLDMKRLNNLRYVTHAVDSYASDYGGAIPTARAGLSQMVTAVADAINLTPLVEQQYCRLNQPPARGYQPSSAGPWAQSNMVLFLGDRNPVMDAIRQRRLNSPLVISEGHDRARHNILTQDGAILWLDQPQVRPDSARLWRARGVLWLVDDIYPRQSSR